MTKTMSLGLVLVFGSLSLMIRADSLSNEIAPDGTVAVEPLSVVPPPPNSAPPDRTAVAPETPVGPGPAGRPRPSGHDLYGTTTETKNPDGSQISVTHFRGNFPQGHGPGGPAHPFASLFPSWNPFPSPYFFPWGPHPYLPGQSPHPGNIQGVPFSNLPNQQGPGPIPSPGSGSGPGANPASSPAATPVNVR